MMDVLQIFSCQWEISQVHIIQIMGSRWSVGSAVVQWTMQCLTLPVVLLFKGIRVAGAAQSWRGREEM